MPVYSKKIKPIKITTILIDNVPIKLLKKLIPIIKITDRIIWFFEIILKTEKDSLIILLFHGLYDKKQTAEKAALNTNFLISPDELERTIKYYLSFGYKFIGPDVIKNGLNTGKNILITFDDGYYNNLLALPILKKYQIPAIFFISTNNVKYAKQFWWDVCQTEMIKNKINNIVIMEKIKSLKRATTDQINEHLKSTFGAEALTARNDATRPFTEQELTDFSKEKYVYLGNHTADHAILINYKDEEINTQIIEAQNYLYKITGDKPDIIAYPNGKYSPGIITIAKQNGLITGITTDQHKNYLPLNKDSAEIMKLGRFTIVGDKNIKSQCRSFRYDKTLSIERLLRKLFKKYEKTATN